MPKTAHLHDLLRHRLQTQDYGIPKHRLHDGSLQDKGEFPQGQSLACWVSLQQFYPDLLCNCTSRRQRYVVISPYQRKPAILVDPFFMARAAFADGSRLFGCLDDATSLDHS